MAVDDICTLRVVGRYEGQNIVNTLHYEITVQTATENLILGGLCEAWLTALETLWLGRHSDQYELIGLKAFRKTGVAKIPAYNPVGTSGDIVTAGVPQPIGRVITLYTASENYRRRGRLQLSGSTIDQFNVTDGAVTNGEQLLMQALADELMELVEGAGNTFRLCIPPTDVLPYEPITGAIARTTPSLTKSRRVKNFLIG